MKLLLRCREATELLSRQQDTELPALEGARLRLHLMVCRACRQVPEQLAFIRRAMRQLSKEQGHEP